MRIHLTLPSPKERVMQTAGFTSLLCVVIFVLLILVSGTQSVYANNPTYQNRCHDYIDSSLIYFNDNALVIQAYRGLPLDTGSLYPKLRALRTKETADFDIVQMVRILYFSNGAYDSIIRDAIDNRPYWINYGDTIDCYWSENHMSMWMSSDWLMHERYGRVVNPSLHNRLQHYLELKVQYGYYEFFSSVYSPYCLSGILNLADFAQDAVIKDLAIRAAKKMLSEYLLKLTNDKGVFFPIAGRNYTGKYEGPYGQNHNNLIYLLTGMGDAPVGASHCGAFLSTSTLSVDTVINSWVPNIDTVYYNGHPFDSIFSINRSQDSLDQIIFQWSCGGYFHPYVVAETGKLLTDSNMWAHVDFKQFYSLHTFPPSIYIPLASSLSSMSESSVLSGAKMAIFKHGSITLSSLEDYWKGKLGFQQFPCVANVGTTAVYTGSGQVFRDWQNRSATNNNEHLPYVEQHKNVALLMYRPEVGPATFGFNHPETAVHFNTNEYDEVRTDSMWLLGRQGGSYVAVRRYCLELIDSVPACHYTTDGQAYVIIVGDSVMYPSFNQFQTLVHNSVFSEQRYFDSVNMKSVYYASIRFDTTFIGYAWQIDSSNTNGIAELSHNVLKVFPNPANDKLSIDYSNIGNEVVDFKIVNMMGQTVYELPEQRPTDNKVTINIADWQQGMYIISGQSSRGIFTQKLLKIE